MNLLVRILYNPAQILTVIFVIIGLMAAIAVLTGRMDSVFAGWNRPPG